VAAAEVELTLPAHEEFWMEGLGPLIELAVAVVVVLAAMLAARVLFAGGSRRTPDSKDSA
jgi:hypothetical protein